MTFRRRRVLWAVACLLAVFAMPGQAVAHAHLVRADLAPDSHLLVPGGTARFWFDEALNPSLSRIVIRNAQGQQVNTDTGRVGSASPEEIDLQLPPLPDGQYTVFWTSDSAQDGHVLHGFYLFTAGGASAQAISSTPVTIAVADTPQFDTTSLSVALAHWLVLVASTSWTGLLALELLVLGPVRARGRDRAARLAVAASARAMPLLRLALLATLVTSLLELETQAYAANGWSGLYSSSVLGDILGSHYGTYWILRMLCAVFALLLCARQVYGLPTPARPGAPRAALSTSGDRANPAAGVPSLALTTVLGLIGLLYLLGLALSGHAAAISQLVFTSVLLDWLHLLASAVWIGGMAAIALTLVPTMIAQAASKPAEARAAFLSLLDSYSPAAFLAAGTAAVTGMFNAQVHLSSLDQLFQTAYGRFLLIKLLLIAEILLLSASHVFLTRPRLQALADGQSSGTAIDAAYDSLALRLRVEPLVGSLILLCVALMGQVAPAVTVFNDTSSTTIAAPAPSSTPVPVVPIQATVSKGVLAVMLTIDHPSVGRTRFEARVREQGKAVTDGQLRIKLSMPSNPSIGAVFVETTPASGGYSGSGDLVQTGTWRAEVLVRTHSDPSEYRDVPFNFVVGSNAAFLIVPEASNRYGPATIRLTQPRNAPGTLQVQLRAGLQVRYEVLMLGMPGMGAGEYRATPTKDGWYSGTIIFPMAGVTRLGIQVLDGGSWRNARVLLYDVDVQGTPHLLAAGTVPPPVASTTTGAAYNLSFALHLPYTALVTRMKNNTVGPL